MPTPDAARPTQPAAWAAQVRLPAAPRAPELGASPCARGGAWRYTLLADPRHPLWRCLHRGALHRGDRALPEDDPAS